MSQVKIESRIMKKPYLGSWNHKITGVKYFNAASQTGPSLKLTPCHKTCSRKIQFVQTKLKTVQLTCNRSTQMWRPDCYISNITDKVVTVKPYESYDEMQLRLKIDARVRTIQRYYRAYRIRKYIKKYAEIYRKMLEDCRKYEEEKAMLYRQRHKEEIFRETYPRTRRDFNMLHSLIDNWKQKEYNRSKAQHFKCSQRANDYCIILEKTTKLLNGVNTQRQFARDAFRKKKRLKILEMNCRALTWNGYKALSIEMITLRTQLAREYKSMYDRLNNETVTAQERIDIFTSLKTYLKVHNCQAVNDLTDLMDQEMTLLSQGVKWPHLKYLRERIKSAFLNFVDERDSCGCRNKFGDKNLEELHKPPENKTMLCRACSRLVPRCRFAMHARMWKLSLCESCAWLQQISIAPINYEPYIFILNKIRVEERSRSSFASISYVMQELDIYYLVNNIWHGHSIISENDDVYLLRLVRFNINEDWTPWNCVLLTEDEAETHYHIRSRQDLYSKYLLRKIMLAHKTAKCVFRNLIILHKTFKESCTRVL